MVNVCAVPLQPFTEGITVMVAVTVVSPVLVAVNMGMPPLPFAVNPMDGALFVQSNEVPVTVSTKVMAVVDEPLHKVCGVMVFTVGIGFTVIVNVSGVPVHPLAEGVTVMVAITGVVPVFVAVNEFMLPFPLAANPMDGVLLVQSNEVPATVSTNVMAVVEAPLHNVCGEMSLTVGVGFTVIVNVSDVPVHTLAEGVTVMVAVTGVLPVLVAAKEAILPFPVAANPMDGLLLVQSNEVPATVSRKVMAVEEAPLHNICGAMLFTVGVGFTVIVKVSWVPVHPLTEGVTVIVAVTGVVPVFVAAKEAMFPLPLAASPMDGLLLVQSNEVPVTVSTKVMAVVEAPLHNVCGEMSFTVGVGFTVIVNVSGVPVHALAEGVTVIVAVTGVLPVLVAAKEAMLPFPLVTSPIDGVSLVQPNEVPVTVSTKVMAVVDEPLHKVCGVMSFTVGIGFTVIVNVSGVPAHPLAEGVTVMVAITGVVPVFVAVNEFMLPFPLAANPMDGVLLVQPNEVPATVSTNVMAVVEAP